MTVKGRVLSLQAHPDDTEFLCAGTLALLGESGWEVHFASLTAGDCGSAELGREEISRIRLEEARASAGLIGGHCHCLGCDDLFIAYDRPTILLAISLMRRVKPALVFAPSPNDYMIDHEITSRIAQTACFGCGVKNVETEGAPAFEPVPHLYYVDPIEGKDKFGKPVEPGIVVDVTSSFETKRKMLACHASQRHWLMVHHGLDEYLRSMEEFAAGRGSLIGKPFGEGFRQHLGHGFPQVDRLRECLGDKVVPLH